MTKEERHKIAADAMNEYIQRCRDNQGFHKVSFIYDIIVEILKEHCP